MSRFDKRGNPDQFGLRQLRQRFDGAAQLFGGVS